MRNDPVEPITPVEEDEVEVEVTVEKKPKANTKRKVGRPKKSKEELKNQPLTSYFTISEHTKLEAEAEQQGLTLANFIRSAVLKQLR